MTGYYADKLSAERLEQCYRIAPPRVMQYLEAELTHVLSRIRSGDDVLDQGCGYGRIMPSLAAKAGLVVGIDIAMASLQLAREHLHHSDNCSLACMDAARTAFAAGVFDVVICIQNGISAFHVDQRNLILESLRVCKPGGIILFSTYSANFWTDRLAWFRLQVEAGLLGEIDEKRTGEGTIVCKDGFRATTVKAKKFRELTSGLDAKIEILEVDDSSLFCEIQKPVAD